MALGPLTNIATALKLDGSIVSKIPEIEIMGGAIDVCGNKNRVAEFNMFVDPEAAAYVFASDIRKTLVPLDVCNQIVLKLEDFERLKGSRYYGPIMAMMSKFIQALYEDDGIEGSIVYDAVAAYYLVNPSAFNTEEMDIVVEMKGEYTVGMTVREKRVAKEKNLNCRECMGVDGKVFRRDFLGILKQ